MFVNLDGYSVAELLQVAQNPLDGTVIASVREEIAEANVLALGSKLSWFVELDKYLKD